MGQRLAPSVHLMWQGICKNMLGHLSVEPVLVKKLEQQKRYAPVAAYLIAPVALVGYVFAAWRLGADLNWLGEFFISSGLFSRWQVWLAIAIATQLVSKELDRIGSSPDKAVL
ncbi:MAG: hypothetical protein WKF37_15820 [Bryobacteraceae bacterium]